MEKPERFANFSISISIPIQISRIISLKPSWIHNLVIVLVRILGFQLWNSIFKKRSYILCDYVYYISMYICPAALWKQPVETLTSAQGWWPAAGVGKRIELHENRSQNRHGMVVFTGLRENQWALLRKVVCRCLLEPNNVGGWKMNMSLLSFKVWFSGSM